MMLKTSKGKIIGVRKPGDPEDTEDTKVEKKKEEGKKTK